MTAAYALLDLHSGLSSAGLPCAESHGFCSASCTGASLEHYSFCCWMDAEQASAQQAALKSGGFVQSWNPNACSISAPLPEPKTADCSHKVSHNTATAFEMPCNSQHGAAGSSAETLAVPLRCATAQNQGGFRSAPLPHSISSGAGAAAAGAGGPYSRHKTLLELWHILTKLRASGCSTLDNAPLSAALEASQAAIDHVNSSMRIVRAALSAADEHLASRALDVATVAVQQAAGRLQAATQLAMHELLLPPPQQQQALHQMWRMQRGEGELDDTCCSMYGH